MAFECGILFIKYLSGYNNCFCLQSFMSASEQHSSLKKIIQTRLDFTAKPKAA